MQIIGLNYFELSGCTELRGRKFTTSGMLRNFIMQYPKKKLITLELANSIINQSDAQSHLGSAIRSFCKSNPPLPNQRVLYINSSKFPDLVKDQLITSGFSSTDDYNIVPGTEFIKREWVTIYPLELVEAFLRYKFSDDSFYISRVLGFRYVFKVKSSFKWEYASTSEPKKATRSVFDRVRDKGLVPVVNKHKTAKDVKRDSKNLNRCYIKQSKDHTWSVNLYTANMKGKTWSYIRFCKDVSNNKLFIYQASSDYFDAKLHESCKSKFSVRDLGIKTGIYFMEWDKETGKFTVDLNKVSED